MPRSDSVAPLGADTSTESAELLRKEKPGTKSSGAKHGERRLGAGAHEQDGQPKTARHIWGMLTRSPVARPEL
jgi:hypothetical protein